jgi:hypothetical protein
MNTGKEFPSAFIRYRRDQSAFGVAAFGRKPPCEFPSLFAALCRDAATSARFPCGIQIADCGIVPLKTMSRLMSAATGEKISSRRQFDARQRGLKCAEKFFLLPDDGIRRGQLLFQSQAGARLGEAQDAPPASQLDEVELNFIAVNHKFILLEIREIATGD